jgi:hypothetical protein
LIKAIISNLFSGDDIIIDYYKYILNEGIFTLFMLRIISLYQDLLRHLFILKSLVEDSGGETQSPPLLNHYISDTCMISGGHFLF